MNLSHNALQVLERRYLRKDSEGKVTETPEGMFRRVAKTVASAELLYGATEKQARLLEEEFYEMMTSLDALPCSPCLMNSGTSLGQLSACFTINIEDEIDSIFKGVWYAAKIFRSGGGCGYNFSKLRPEGDFVGSTQGVASGPISFMRIYNVATEVVKQGGKRRGANMAILNCSHPNILEFIDVKSRDDNPLNNFNLSVGITDEFMRQVEHNGEYQLINPRTHKPTKTLKAREVFNKICSNTWLTGDPAMIFLDEVNRYNTTPHLGKLEILNPCGEQPLLPYESCSLMSINLSHMLDEHNQINWNKLERTTRLCTRFLDNTIDVTKFPLKEIEEATLKTRKIGLGIMGLADMLIMMGIAYNSERGLEVAGSVMKFIHDTAMKESECLANEKGTYPAYIPKNHPHPVRNAALTTIAPTGTISIIAGCSSGIEPLFALAYARNVMDNTKLIEANPLFEQELKKLEFNDENLMEKIANTGSCQNIKEVPERIRSIFVTSMDIAPEWHVRMQSECQKHIHNAVSKTVNLPPDATVEDVANIYMLAWKLKCKGVTAYRYGSKKEQVLYVGS